MGQALSRGDGTGVCRVEHEALLEHCRGLERANDGLKKVTSERDTQVKQLHTCLTKTKAELDSTQNSFFSVEKQLRELHDKHQRTRPEVEKLKVELAEARHDAAHRVEEVSKLKLTNSALEEQAKSATSKASALREELSTQEQSSAAAIDGMKAKNAELREQLQGQQEELASLKNSISMINNIVDSTATSPL